MQQSQATPSLNDIMAEITKLKAENEALKAAKASKAIGKLSLKIGEKGGLCVVGLGRFPVTLYKDQWLTLLAKSDDIKAFIVTHATSLKEKE